MRIFSDKVLSWTQILHVNHGIRTYSNLWNNYHIYLLQDLKPLTIYSKSSLSILEENRYYYCYKNYIQDVYSEGFDNNYGVIRQYNKLYGVYYPENATFGDFIVIYKEPKKYFPVTDYRPLLA